jgi:hypothetical protein
LINIFLITLCAKISGVNDWETVAKYGRTKGEWLKTFLALAKGILLHNTFARLNPEGLQS